MPFRWCLSCGRKRVLYKPLCNNRYVGIDSKPFRCLECGAVFSHAEVGVRVNRNANYRKVSNPERVEYLSALLRRHCKAMQ